MKACVPVTAEKLTTERAVPKGTGFQGEDKLMHPHLCAPVVFLEPAIMGITVMT